MIVGGGAGGVELALAMQHRLLSELEKAGQSSDRVEFKLVTRGEPMPTHPPATRKTFRHIFASRGIELVEGDGVDSVSKDEVWLASGRKIRTDECIWCTQAAPQAWPGRSLVPIQTAVHSSVTFVAVHERAWCLCRRRCCFSCGPPTPESRSVCRQSGSASR